MNRTAREAARLDPRCGARLGWTTTDPISGRVSAERRARSWVSAAGQDVPALTADARSLRLFARRPRRQGGDVLRAKVGSGFGQRFGRRTAAVASRREMLTDWAALPGREV